VKDEEEENIIK